MAWHPHLDVWLLLGLPLVAYFWAISKLGPQRAGLGDPPATSKHKITFVLGVITLWVASDWPVHELSEQFLYSVHMVQHLLITFLAPPLLLLGMPPWLLRMLLPGPVMGLARRATKPLPALIAFNGAVVLTHWPVLVDWTLRVEGAHFGAHLILFVTALMMWTPVIGPLLELPRLSYPGRMLFLFLQSIIPTVPASFLTFAEKPIYKFYETAPRIISMSALTDQRVAGLIMKIGGGFILWSIIGVMFFRWHALEESVGMDVLGWHDVDTPHGIDKVRLSE